MTRLRSHPSVRAAALGLTALLSSGSDASAQVDYLPLALEVTQSIQNGNLDLVAERPTFLRTTVRMVNGGASPPAVDGLLYVYDGGVEVEGSPFFSDNGPYVPPNPPDKSFLDGTLNFTILPPVGDDVTFEIVVNPAGPTQVPGEANPNNNLLSAGPYEFLPRKVPDMIYSPIDYRPSGGSTPNPPDEALIRPGVGDNFIQGIYPVPDWDYHRTDAPSKLWTSSLSGTGSTLNNSLTTDLNLTVPQPDYIYGWVPGSLPYNGQAIIGGVASMGNTQQTRHQRTFAHELGHCTGLFHDSTTAGVYGIDVEHHLAITQLLPKVKVPSAFGIMVPGQLTPTAWCEQGDYNAWINLPKFQVNDAALDAGDEVPLLLVSGAWNTATGAVSLHDVLSLPEPGRLSPSAPSSEILIGAWAGDSLVRQIAVGNVTSSDCSDSLDDASPLVGFNALMPALGPAGETVDRIVISQGGARGLSSAVLTRSAHAPEVAFTAPTGSVLEGGLLTVAWEGSDADGDALTYYLRWSRDGQEFSPLHTSTRDTSFTLDVSGLPALVDGQGFFELLASDGLNTSVVRTAPLTRGASYAGGGNAPWAHILTPDDNTTLLQGQNAILHGMAWDIEDDGLTGGDVVWTSDVDGLIGSGRRITTDSLSPGVHEITLTVTDGDGQQGTWDTTVTVLGRDLPDIDGEICQVDLGNGGPGSASLSICGGDLSSGTTADLSLTGAPANATAWFVIGSANTPTPFKGGTLVPVPVLEAIAVTTDGAGSFGINGIAGGGGPASFYVQFVIVDAGQALGFGLSNAVQVDYLP